MAINPRSVRESHLRMGTTPEADSVRAMRNVELMREQELLGRFPDLKNSKSDFFRGAALRYGSLVRAGMKPAEAIEMAARETAAQFIRDGRIYHSQASNRAKTQ